jgi:hypothetical protein
MNTGCGSESEFGSSGQEEDLLERGNETRCGVSRMPRWRIYAARPQAFPSLLTILARLGKSHLRNRKSGADVAAGRRVPN